MEQSADAQLSYRKAELSPAGAPTRQTTTSRFAYGHAIPMGAGLLVRIHVIGNSVANFSKSRI